MAGWLNLEWDETAAISMLQGIFANKHSFINVMHLAYPECDEIPIPLPVSRIDDKSEKVDGRRTLI